MKVGDQLVYMRHLTHRDHFDLEEIQDHYLNRAIKEGLSDLKTREKHIVSTGLWSEKKDRQIFDQKTYIKGMMDGRKNIHLPSILGKINIQIKEEQEKLDKLESEKSNLIGLTAEAFSSKRCNDYYIIKSLYKDKEMKLPLFTEDVFDDLSDDEVNDIILSYNQTTTICSDFNIKKLTIQDFYQSYYYLCEDDFTSFFGKPICDFTFLQIKLANYSRYFKNILQGVDINNLPEKVRNDPDELVSYLDVRKKGQEMISQAGAGQTTLVGATREDLKAIAGEDGVAKIPTKPMTMMEMMKEMNK
jgi:hypothetical protein